MSSDLLPGENLILKDHPHWIVVVKSLVVPVVLLIAAAVVDLTVTNTGIPNFRVIVTLVGVAIAGIWLIVVWIRWQSVAYTLTDQRIKIESGVFGRQSKMIPIDRVQDCTTKMSLLGRMLGYGRVQGEAAFRAIESQLLPRVLQPGAVVALGGGAPVDESNWRLIVERSTTVFLDCGFDTIWNRISGTANRPLLAANSRLELEALLQQRRPRYMEAVHRVDGDRSADAVADEILQIWSDC